MNFTEIQDITVEEWLKRRIHHRDVFDLLITLCRVVTYANDPEIQSAVQHYPSFKWQYPVEELSI
jgi:hypothetical protein